MAIRTKTIREYVNNTQTKKYLRQAMSRGFQLESKIPSQQLDGFNAILLDYEQYAINIQNDNYAAMDAALDIVIVN